MFFHDATDIRELMMQYVLLITPAVTMVAVSGDARGYNRRTRRARNSTDALVDWFCHLHSLGYALDGVFSKDSFGIDYMGCLRGLDSLLALVKPIGTIVDGVKRNMAAVAAIIENDIHEALQIPEDLSHLLDGLKNYSIQYSSVVRHHISHEEADIKTAISVRMYKRLRVIEEIDSAKHARILQSIQQFSGTSPWLGRAMRNVHLHRVLRHKPWKGKAKSLTNVVTNFLTTKVQYTDDMAGWLTCRRNGEAHMESDSSVDTIGYTEAAIFGAAEGLNLYHRMQHNADVAAAVQPLQPLASRCLEPMDPSLASMIGNAVEQFLSGNALSLDAAKEGAAVAAKYLVRHSNTSGSIANAVAAAAAAAQGVQGGAVLVKPLVMFDAEDVDHIYHIVAPRMMAAFQLSMFKEDEPFRLGNDTCVPRLG